MSQCYLVKLHSRDQSTPSLIFLLGLLLLAQAHGSDKKIGFYQQERKFDKLWCITCISYCPYKHGVF